MDRHKTERQTGFNNAASYRRRNKFCLRFCSDLRCNKDQKIRKSPMHAVIRRKQILQKSIVVTAGVYARSLSDDRMGIRRLCHVAHCCIPPAPRYPNNWPHFAGPCVRSPRPGGPAAVRPCNTLGHRLRWPPAAGNRQQITLRRRPICCGRDYVTSRIARLRQVSTDGSRTAASIQRRRRRRRRRRLPASRLTDGGRRCDQCLLADGRSVQFHVW